MEGDAQPVVGGRPIFGQSRSWVEMGVEPDQAIVELFGDERVGRDGRGVHITDQFS